MLVIRVEVGGAAAIASLAPGDVITSIAGKAIHDLHHFHEMLSRYGIGEVVDVRAWRAGELITIPAILTEKP